MITLKNILVPTDFSENSQLALNYGKELAEAFRASLHVLHVLQPLNMVFPALDPTYAPPPYLDALEQSARQQLERALSEADRKKFNAQVALVMGPPFVEIDMYARKQQIDLIVMGTHGRGPLTRMLLGSVADKIVRKASCPVLVVRPEEHQFVTA